MAVDVTKGNFRHASAARLRRSAPVTQEGQVGKPPIWVEDWATGVRMEPMLWIALSYGAALYHSLSFGGAAPCDCRN
jgi:hypothetical protein